MRIDMLLAEDLRFAYSGCDEILKGVSLGVERGRRLAVVGENGSGKTTLARLMCGLLEPTAGSVAVDELDTRRQDSIFEVRRRVGLVFQDPDDQIVETTVEREIAFGPRNLGLSLGEIDRRVNETLATFGIESLRKRACHLLSAGEKQILTVASVFAMQPAYIVLDESTSLLDAGSRREAIGAVERLLDATGAGLVFISMRLEDVWTCHEVVFLRNGLVDFRGTKDGLLRHLKRHAFPLSGAGLLAGKLDDAVPGFLSALAECDSLSGDSLASVLVRLAGSGGAGALGAGGPAPCR
jgi:energy-coupling factor transport system ATP-binding protein